MRLCINCDDFNLERRIDDGILKGVDAGLITSVSAFSRGYGESGISRLSAYPDLSVGLHFDLTSGCNSPAASPWSLAHRVLMRRISQTHIESLLHAQYGSLRRELGRSVSHLDTHEHVHVLRTVRAPMLLLADRESIPYVRVPVETGAPRSIKSCLLHWGFGRPHPRVAFMGLELMDGRMNARSIRESLEQLARCGVDRVLWMIHAGHGSAGGIHGRDDYPYREHELRSLVENRSIIREHAELVSLPMLLS